MKDVTEGAINEISCSASGLLVHGHKVGQADITKITRRTCKNTGVRYIQVWKGEKLFAEYDQRGLMAIYRETEVCK